MYLFRFLFFVFNESKLFLSNNDLLFCFLSLIYIIFPSLAFLVGVGFGADAHGQNVTKAAGK